MPDFVKVRSKVIYNRVKHLFYRPYRTFNIGWIKEKVLKHQKDQDLKHHLYKKKYKIAYRDGLLFLISVKELFIHEFYKFRPDTDRPKIIDCGSYIGTSILYFKDNYPNAEIIGFEPDGTNYSLLKENIENWNFTNIKVRNAAIWTYNGKISFHSIGSMGSRIEAGADQIAKENEVDCVRLKDLLNEEIDFLKIDIEGAEYEVLKDCAYNLKNVKNIFIEYHGTYDELSQLNEILNILLRNNFKYYITEGIAVYLRPFWDREKMGEFDMLLNISAFKN